jgi:hypothetical protein
MAKEAQRLERIDIQNTEDVRRVLTDEINELRTGNSNPARANAVANLTGKMLSSVKLDIDVHRYVTSGKHQKIKSLKTQLIDTEKQLTK